MIHIAALLQTVEQISLLDADTLLAFAAIITAAAGFYRGWLSTKNVKALETKVAEQDKKIASQGERITEQDKRIMELTQENRDLREQNAILAGVNEEYRTRLLNAVEDKPRKRTGD